MTTKITVFSHTQISHRWLEYCGALLLCLFCSQAIGQTVLDAQQKCPDHTSQKRTVNTINLSRNPIFDEDAADSIFLHKWANALHIVTKPVIIRDRLTFDEGDEITQEDIIEAEAILRAQRFLANAEITTVNNCQDDAIDLNIETYDNWSLIPTLSFSRSGGENNVLIGVREDNLLGLGIRTTARYTQDEQRSGYQLAFSSIVPWVRHANLSLRLEDNDDGEIYNIVFDKPFYHLNTQNSYFLRASHISREDDIFQNNQTRNSYQLDAQEFTAAYGWSLLSSNELTTRLTLGMTYDKATFALAPQSPSAAPSLVPQSRDFFYPWVSLEYAERDITVMKDIYLINQPEDINLGIRFISRLGVEIENEESGVGLHANVDVRKGILLSEMQLLMLSGSLNAITNAGVSDFIRLDTGAEYFFRPSTLIGFYARLHSTFSKGQFLDRPIVIDDANGVRGFPNQYQHGNHRISSSAEIRLYTNYSIYQIFEVGFAAFADAGRAFNGEQAQLNEDPSLLSSVGIGARLFSNKASNSGVVHIDVAKPITNGDTINTWEWSLQLKRSF
ncbi:outer membrane protein assembly factor [Alteromonas sp. A081]|uniref:outer membrane protein assembly factor n=1 Tax=Alteromonas sp. A081 TaxID=3410269 RepID=UPI003B987D4A